MYGSEGSSVIPPRLMRFEGAQAADRVVFVEAVLVYSVG